MHRVPGSPAVQVLPDRAFANGASAQYEPARLAGKHVSAGERPFDEEDSNAKRRQQGSDVV